MSTDKIKLDYALADEMVRTFDHATSQLQETLHEMQNLAKTLEDGALLGQGGDSFGEAFKSNLFPSLTRLINKYHELSGDVKGAKKDMQEADKASAGYFKG